MASETRVLMRNSWGCGLQGSIGTVGRVEWLALVDFAKMTCCICLFAITFLFIKRQSLTLSVASGILATCPAQSDKGALQRERMEQRIPAG